MIRFTPLFFTIFLLWITLPLANIHPLDLYGGVAGAYHTKYQDGFDNGVDRFHSNALYYGPRIWRGKSFDSFGALEAYFRVGDFAGPQHSVGFLYTSYRLPVVELADYTPPDSFFQNSWYFTADSLMITYHYQFAPFRFKYLKKWIPELGGGFGIVLSPQWKGEGWTYSNYYGFLSHNTDQSAEYGNSARLELAMIRYFTSHLYLRLALTGSYVHISGFTGSVQNSEGGWYVLEDGGFAPISTSTIGLIPPDTVTDTGYTGFMHTVTGRGSLTIGSTSFSLGVGIKL